MASIKQGYVEGSSPEIDYDPLDSSRLKLIDSPAKSPVIHRSEEPAELQFSRRQAGVRTVALTRAPSFVKKFGCEDRFGSPFKQIYMPFRLPDRSSGLL